MINYHETPANSPESQAAGAAPVSRPGAMSLEGMHDSVKVPHHKAGFLKQMVAYFGPAILVSVAYMDPGTGEPISREAPSSNTDCFGSSAWPA